MVRIEIGDVPIRKPHYAKKLSDSAYIRHVGGAWEVRKNRSNPQSEFYKDYHRDVLAQLARDPQYFDYLVNLLQRGSSKDNGYNEFEWDYYLSILADAIVHQQQAVELIPKSKRLNLVLSSPNQGLISSEETALATTEPTDFSEALPRLGLHLTEGLIICRGNVDRVESLDGGTIYVDGDVNVVDSCQSGVIYIKGDLYHLGSTEREVIIVAGRIHEYVQNAHYPSGGFYTERLPSPFVFTPHPIQGQRVGEKIQHHVVQNTVAYSNTARPFEGAHIVDVQRLVSWTPQETVENALELCRERISADLDKIRQMTEEVPTAKVMGQFYDRYVAGYLIGRNRGFFDGLHNALGPGD